jgi:hypothetical protein
LNVLLLAGLVVAYCAACSGAENTVMPCEVTRNSTDHGTFDAALRIGWGSEGEQGNSHRSETQGLGHAVTPQRIEIAGGQGGRPSCHRRPLQMRGSSAFGLPENETPFQTESSRSATHSHTGGEDATTTVLIT